MKEDRASQSLRAALAIVINDRISWSFTYAVPRLMFDNHTLQRKFKASIVCNWGGLDRSTERRFRRKRCYIPDGTEREAWSRCKLASREMFTMNAEASRPSVVSDESLVWFQYKALSIRWKHYPLWRRSRLYIGDLCLHHHHISIVTSPSRSLLSLSFGEIYTCRPRTM